MGAPAAADGAKKEQPPGAESAPGAGVGGGKGGPPPKPKKVLKKGGVCYLSRIPPHMKPLKLRHLLSQYAEVGRIYLAPEDTAIRMRRKKAGGNSGKNFTEGWVEFARKKDAKRVAALLNGEMIGGKRRSAYHFDLWNIKYLHKFKWDHLTEEIAYRNAVREQKLAAEISAATKERDFYLAKVDQSRAIRAMVERRQKRSGGAPATRDGAAGGEPAAGAAARPPGGVAAAAAPEKKRAAVLRRFHQRQTVADPASDAAPRMSADVLSRVLGGQAVASEGKRRRSSGREEL